MESETTVSERADEQAADQGRTPEVRIAPRRAPDRQPVGNPALPIEGADHELPHKVLRPVARPRTRREKDRHCALVKEFRCWKEILVGWIRRDSKIETLENGAVVFVFPPRLVKTVLAVADRERLTIIEGWKQQVAAETERARREHRPPPSWPPDEQDLVTKDVVNVEEKTNRSGSASSEAVA
jgi:hypothetical protein